MSLPEPDQKRRFVEQMFDGIAPRYQLMNQLMTFGIDRSWRRATIAALGLRAGDRVLDLGCGPGDLGETAATTGATVFGFDISTAMLRQAHRRRPDQPWARADAQCLPIRNACCDAVMSGFAMRNFTSLPTAFAESARVLRRGGRLAILEVDVPRSALARQGFDFYFSHVVPVLGRLLSEGYAYRYLPASLAYLPTDAELAALLAEVGFVDIRKQRLSAGAAQLVTAARG